MKYFVKIAPLFFTIAINDDGFIIYLERLKGKSNVILKPQTPVSFHGCFPGVLSSFEEQKELRFRNRIT